MVNWLIANLIQAFIKYISLCKWINYIKANLFPICFQHHLFGRLFIWQHNLNVERQVKSYVMITQLYANMLCLALLVRNCRKWKSPKMNNENLNHFLINILNASATLNLLDQEYNQMLPLSLYPQFWNARRHIIDRITLTNYKWNIMCLDNELLWVEFILINSLFTFL